jgi:hypothetical protein
MPGGGYIANTPGVGTSYANPMPGDGYVIYNNNNNNNYNNNYNNYDERPAPDLRPDMSIFTPSR